MAPRDRSSRDDAPGMRIGSFVGVPVFIGWTWLILAAGLTWLFGAPHTADLGLLGYAVGLAIAVGLLVSVLVHEAAHALSARAFGLRVRRIVADLMGGHTAFEGRTTPWSQGVTGLSGPLANLVLAGLFFAVALVLGDGVTGFVVARLAVINLLLAVFNLLPGLPLDGGQVLMAAVWRLTGSAHTASVVAGWSGRVVAVIVVLVFLGAPMLDGTRPSLFNILIIVLIASFLWRGATQAIAVGHARRRLSRVEIGQILRPVTMVPADAPVATWFQGSDRAYVTVGADGHPEAIVRADALAAVPREQWDRVPASAVAATAPAHWVREVDEPPTAELVLSLLAQSGASVLLIVHGGAVAGIVFAADAMRALGQ